MASWNSYAPWWWQSLYQPGQVNENELSDLAESYQPDGAKPLESRRKTPVSLLEDLARLPAAPSFDNFPARPLYPFLGAPGAMQWFDSAPFFGTGLGPAAAAAPSFHSAGVPASPFLGTPGQINWPDPPKPPVRPVEHLASAQFWPVRTMPSPIHRGRLPDDAFSPSRNFQTFDTDAVPRDRFADAAQEFPEFQPQFPSRAPAEVISRVATNEPPDQAAVVQDARRAAAMRTGQQARPRRREYELDLTEPESNSAVDGSEPNPGERARLNLVNSYYRNSLAGAGRLKFLKYVASTPDPEGSSPANKNLRQAFRNQYRQIAADLERYDRVRAAKTPSEFGAVAAEQQGESLRGGAPLQYDPIGTTGGINRYAYVGTDPIDRLDPFGHALQPGDTTPSGRATNAFDQSDDANASPIPVQWFSPLVRPFVGRTGVDTLLTKPPASWLPEGLTRAELGRLTEWGNAMKAKPWAEQIANNPQFRGEILKKLKGAGFTREMIGNWAAEYGQAFGKPFAEQFGHRANGLRHLYEKWTEEGNSATPALPSVISPYGEWCPDPKLCT